MHFLKQPNPKKLAGKLRERKISRREFNAASFAEAYKEISDWALNAEDHECLRA